MADTATQQPRVLNIDDLLRNKDRLDEGSDMQRLATQRLGQNRRRAQRKPLARDNQQQEMTEAMQSGGGTQPRYGANQSRLPASPPGGPALPQQQPQQTNQSNQDQSETQQPQRTAEQGAAPDTVRPGEEGAAGASLREQTLKKKQDEAKKQADGAKDEADGAGLTGGLMQQPSRNALRWAWGVLATVAGFPFGLTYINAHVFLSRVFGDELFCKLGEEWAPKELAALAGRGTGGKVLSKNIGLVEVMVLLLLDIVVGGLIFGALGIIVMIATWLGESWWGQLTYIWEALWGLGFGSMKALVDLFTL